MAERAQDVPADGGAGRQQAARPRLRASDADRAATVAVLQDAVGRGLLSPDEGSERMAAAFAATHLDQLPGLTVDLPAPTPAAGRPAPGWRTLGSLAAAQARSSLATGPTRSPRANAALAVVAVLVVLFLMALVLAGLAGLHGGPPDGWHGHPYH